MITSTITERGQTTLPKLVREALKLEAGRKLIYEIHGDTVTIKPHAGVMASFGALKARKQGLQSNWKEARAAAKDEWATHAAQEGLPE
jgi:AbrB family looped-hinge helix DNA binding protein